MHAKMSVMRLMLLNAASPRAESLLVEIVQWLRADVYGAEYWSEPLEQALLAAAHTRCGNMVRRSVLWLTLLAREPAVQALVDDPDEQKKLEQFLPYLRVQTTRLHLSNFLPSTTPTLLQRHLDRCRDVWLHNDTAAMDAARDADDYLTRYATLPPDE